MRQIHFKAWDKIYSLLCDVGFIDWDGDTILIRFPESFKHSLGFEYRNFGQVELLQYTGLKDKNGKEIWEGDIIHFWYPLQNDSGFIVEIIWQDNYYEGDLDVGYRIVGFGVKYSDGTTSDLPENDLPVEIIGNIYEHSHLLNK